jgi:amino acid adenylation domain-containing protein
MLGLIEKAAEAGIILYVEDEQLKYRQLGSEFPDDIKQHIRKEKEHIIAYLTNKNRDDSPSERLNILRQLENKVKEHPSKAALLCEGDSLTYQAFFTQVETLAKYIVNNAQDKPVALLLGRGMNTMIAIYAALRANVAYVPIEVANPQERISYYLDDSSTCLLVTEERYVDCSDSFDGKVALIEQALVSSKELPVQLPLIDSIESDSPAYIIYTSGSTGSPKGVVCSHDNLSHFGEVMKQQFTDLALDNDGKWLWNASYAFDASLKGVVALAQGMILVVPTELDVKDPKAIIKLIREHDIQVINTLPTVMEYILPHLESTKTYINLIVSGENVSNRLWAKLYEYSVPHNRKVINAYGPTETSVNASYELQKSNERVSIGRAAIGIQLYVLNDNRQEVPDGEEGELYISGSGVALSYLNRQEATESNFVTLPESQTRAFKTGDVVKKAEDGKLQYLGRIDNQVKYRGYRIELDEIRVKLNEFDGISDTAVVTTTSFAGPRIEAYFVVEKAELSIADIQAYLDLSLPEYMHPTKLEFVDEIPLTSGGKVDKSRLIVSKPFSESQDGPQKTDVASRISAIWSQVLEVQEIEPEDDFFRLGGHSLLAMQLLQSIDDEFGVAMEVGELFSLLTLQSQIDWLTENLSDLEIDTELYSAANNAIENAIEPDGKGNSNERVELEL